MRTPHYKKNQYSLDHTDPNSTEMIQHQQEIFLATKIRVPRPRSSYVNRSALTARLRMGLEGKLTLLSAPAGSGKTALLAYWLQTCGLPVAWLTLGDDENEPARFFSYLRASLQTVHPALGDSLLSLPQVPQSASAEYLMTLLSNEITSSEVPPFILALDDYHTIQSEVIHTALIFLLQHLPPQMHLAIATRTDPPFPLTRLRVRGELTELRDADFRMNTNEIEKLLQMEAGFHFSTEAIATIESRTEGWVAGVQLAAHALRNTPDPRNFLQAFHGSHRLVLDYLSEEILFQQPEPIQEFLLTTCILERLQRTLCNAMTGLDNGQGTLEALEKANLFVTSLDETREWYRYHPLFAEALRVHLQQSQPERVASLHERASQWYEQQGLFVDAIHHAMNTRDKERATVLLRAHGLTCLLTLEIPERVLEWLQTLPDTHLQQLPDLCFLRALSHIYLNHPEAAGAWLQYARDSLETIPSAGERTLLHARIVACNALIQFSLGEVALSAASAREALDLLPVTETILRSHMMQYAIRGYRASGDVSTATERMAVSAVVSARASNNQTILLVSMSNLGWIQILRGRFHQAAATYREIEQILATTPPRAFQAGKPNYYICFGFLLYAWNQLDLAEERLTQGLEQIKAFPLISGDLVTLGYTTMADLHRSRGEFGRALEMTEELQQFHQQYAFSPALISVCAATQAEIEMARGNLSAAIQWADHEAPAIADPAEYPYERSYLAWIRVRLAQSKVYPHEVNMTDILRIVDRLLADAESKNRTLSFQEIQVLRVLALASLQRETEALEALERVLKYAEPEFMVNLLANEGEPIVQLLLKIATAYPRKQAYIQQVITACTLRGEEAGQTATTAPMQFAINTPQPQSTLPESSEPTLPAHSPQGLADPLSGRELEVLRLISEGASNHDIADRLVIAISTVKRHITNIFAKLDASNRTQAVAKARQSGLL